jgi:hypothetical protein
MAIREGISNSFCHLDLAFARLSPNGRDSSIER